MQRKSFTAEFKAKVALEALRSNKDRYNLPFAHFFQPTWIFLCRCTEFCTQVHPQFAKR